MDVDNDLDGQLLQQFSSLGTTDKDVLIAEFQKFLGNQLSPTGCAFFLDMNNWNLQAAICSYYDFDQTNNRLPSLTFISDITVGEGEAVPPETKFTKTWRIQNSGDESWPPGCHLRFVSGDNLSLQDRVIIDTLRPGEVTDVTVELHSGSVARMYQSQWRICTPTGQYFGEPIWVIVNVDEGGVMAVTQQLSQFGSDFVQSSAHDSAIPNPFASPVKLSGDMNNAGYSPNSSVMAQQGSPYTTQLSPSPVRTPHTSTTAVSTPRSLFQPPASDGGQTQQQMGGDLGMTGGESVQDMGEEMS